MIVGDRYQLEDSLGAGGESQVFRARDLVNGQEVAVRLSSGETGGLPVAPPHHHKGWARLLDHGLDPAQGRFSVFELLRGETLGRLVEERGPLDPAALRDFIVQSLDAVGALHAAGWVHGDLNAENFIRQESATWKLLELPFHRGADRAHSPLFGSIYTLAPEQIDGHRPDARSDLFALGCLYYYAASGDFPHAGGSEAGMAVARLRFPPKPLELAGGDPALAAWIMRLLARQPANRPAGIAAAHQLLGGQDRQEHASR